MPDLREALESKYDELESGPAPEQAPAAPETEPTQTAAAPEPSTTTDTRPRDESGKFVEKKATKTEPPAKAEGISTKPAVIGGQPTATTPAPVVTPPTVTKAPQSLKPAARELWAKLGPEYDSLKQDIIRRERETAVAIQQAAEAKKGSAALQELTRPYEAVIRQSGLDTPKYVENLLQTAYRLNTSDPQSRAHQMADLFVQFGVSPADLYAALVTRIQGGQAPRPTPQQFHDPRFDAFMQQIEQARATREQALAEESSTMLETFAESHEFVDDVKDEMADILEVWAKRGKTDVSPEDVERAYTIACQNNPDVAPLLEQRRAAEAAQKAIASTARSKVAASSVKNEPAAPLGAQPVGRREALERAYDELNSR